MRATVYSCCVEGTRCGKFEKVLAAVIVHGSRDAALEVAEWKAWQALEVKARGLARGRYNVGAGVDVDILCLKVLQRIFSWKNKWGCVCSRECSLCDGVVEGDDVR